jgi:hypothetical protein
MTDITDDVIDQIDAYFRSGNSVPVTRATIKFEEWQAAKALLQRQRERQAVAVPDGEWRKLAHQFDRHRMQAIAHLKTLLENPESHRQAVIDFLAAPPADTVKQDDAMRKAGEELLAAYTEPFPMGTEGQEAQDAWGLRQKNAVEAMRQALANNGDCPHPIEEELTK